MSTCTTLKHIHLMVILCNFNANHTVSWDCTDTDDTNIINGQKKNKTTPNTVTAFCCPRSEINGVLSTQIRRAFTGYNVLSEHKNTWISTSISVQLDRNTNMCLSRCVFFFSQNDFLQRWWILWRAREGRCLIRHSRQTFSHLTCKKLSM